MSEPSKWQDFWDEKSGLGVSDYEFDRGTTPRDAEIEELSTREFLEFVAPDGSEVLFDAGCGTGMNMFLLRGRVRRVIGMDFSEAAIARCRRRIEAQQIQNVEIQQGNLTAVPLPERSVDKIICMSVLHYLDDAEVRTVFREFARILRGRGVVILHVKNISSLYLSTLWLAKRVKLLLGRRTKLEYFRSFCWYARELAAAGLELEHYNSFNLLMVEGMPRRALQFLQRLELRNYKRFPLRTRFLRRRGSDLKLRARVASGQSAAGSCQ